MCAYTVVSRRNLGQSLIKLILCFTGQLSSGKGEKAVALKCLRQKGCSLYSDIDRFHFSILFLDN